MARIAVIGVGKVGLPMACHLADLGRHEISVFDTDKRILNKLREKVNPCPREEGIIFDFRILESLEEGLAHADWFFIVTPTPLVGKTLSSCPVSTVISELAEKTDRKISINVVSTLDPRDADMVCRQRANIDVTYNPPLIRLGQVKRDLREAKILFLGRTSTHLPKEDPVLNELEEIWGTYGAGRTPRVIRGDVTSIACAKLAINATLSMRGAWGNDVAKKAMELGANVDTVFEALSAEPRIGGSSYMLPGPPPGGPCLPRDSLVWNDINRSPMSESVMVTHDETTRLIVRNAVIWVGENARIGKEFQPADKHVQIAVMGMGYKLNALDITGGIGVEVALAIKRTLGFTPICYDPSVSDMVKSAHPDLQFVETADEAVRVTDAAVICLDYPECKKALENRMSYRSLVLDFKRNGQ